LFNLFKGMMLSLDYVLNLEIARWDRSSFWSYCLSFCAIHSTLFRHKATRPNINKPKILLNIWYGVHWMYGCIESIQYQVCNLSVDAAVMCIAQLHTVFKCPLHCYFIDCRYRNGFRGHMRNIVRELIRSYLQIEKLFQTGKFGQYLCLRFLSIHKFLHFAYLICYWFYHNKVVVYHEEWMSFNSVVVWLFILIDFI